MKYQVGDLVQYHEIKSSVLSNCVGRIVIVEDDEDARFDYVVAIPQHGGRGFGARHRDLRLIERAGRPCTGRSDRLIRLMLEERKGKKPRKLWRRSK